MLSLLSLRLRSRASSCVIASSLDWCILHITCKTFVWLQHTCSDRTRSNTVNITQLIPAELRIWNSGWSSFWCCKAEPTRFANVWLEMCIFTISEWFSVSLQLFCLFLVISRHSHSQWTSFCPPPSAQCTHPGLWVDFPFKYSMNKLRVWVKQQLEGKDELRRRCFPKVWNTERHDSRTDVPTPLIKGKKQQRQSCWSF